MRKPLSLATFFLLSLTLLAQKSKDIPAFGKVDKAELEMTECDFDKKAEAVVLFDVAELSCRINNGNVYTELQRHIRIKILKDKGLDHANIHIPYVGYRTIENIRNLSAQTYNLDGGGNILISKLEKKLIYNKKIDSRISEEVFTFPEVKAGSIIEYRYNITGAGLDEWYFQRSIPVKFSRYIINFPPEFEVYCQPICSLPVETENETGSQRYVNKYTMRNIPALRDEPHMSCENDYLQRLEPRIIAVNTPAERINLVPSWPTVIKELMEDEDFGVQLGKEIPRTADLDEQLKKITDPFQKMITIHNYVRKSMEWNGYSSIWALDGVKSAWKDKKGTSGEINLILVNLLKDANLKAHPILLSTRKNGRIVASIPGVSQFDRVMAQVKIDNKTYILDGAEKYTPSRLIPEEVMYSEGLVIEKLDTYEWGWMDLWDEKKLNKNLTMLRTTISDAGKLSGVAMVYNYDYAKLDRLPDLKEDKEKYIEKYFTSKNQGLTIDSLNIEDEDKDSLPLLHKISFSQAVTSSGEYLYVSLNMFSGLEKNPFIADSRFSDVFFGTNQQHSIVGSLTIPVNYSFESLPKNIRMIMPDTSISITRQISSVDNTLSFRINLEFKRPFYAVDEYPDFREFYKQVFALLSEQIVFRKKGT